MITVRITEVNQGRGVLEHHGGGLEKEEKREKHSSVKVVEVETKSGI
jgi:hypothetical protein